MVKMGDTMISSQGSAPKISVILTVRDGAGVVDRAVASILRQTNPRWELFAVDDGSTDATLERLNNLAWFDARIRVLSTGDRRGQAAAWNLAMRYALGTMITYLDGNDEYYPEYLEQVARLGEQGDVLIFGYDYIKQADGEIPELGTWTSIPYRHLLFLDCPAIPLGVAHRRALWEQVGGFDENLWQAEHWDFLRRLARHGAAVHFLDLRSGLYHLRDSSPWSEDPQLTSAEARVRHGNSLRRERPRPTGLKPVERILFVSHRDEILHTGSSSLSSKVLNLLDRDGLTCQAFCASPDIAGLERSLAASRLPSQSEVVACGPQTARMLYSCVGQVPITWFQARRGQFERYSAEDLAAFPSIYATFLDAYRPDAVIAPAPQAGDEDDPVGMGLIRLAKRRDIPVVFLCDNLTSVTRRAFEVADYCVVTSDSRRRHYWDTFGLDCRTLTPTTDDQGPDWAAFVRDLFPQPGPPLLVRPSVEISRAIPASCDHALTEIEMPARLGKYRPLRELGRGSMGVVYEAVRTDGGRHVALKTPRPERRVLHEERARFRSEARVASSLRHPHIIPILDIGEQEMTPYFTMPLIRGRTLEEVLAELARLRGLGGPRSDVGRPHATDLAEALLTGRFERRFASQSETRSERKVSTLTAQPNFSLYFHAIAHLGVQVATALSYAHAQGIIHRDVKPANLLLDARGFIHIADFGLARDGIEAARGSKLRGIGTPKYRAPEQAQGRSDPRSDVFSLGKTLDDFVIPLRTELVIPQALEAILSRAVAPDPHHRFATAADLGEALARFAGDRMAKSDA